MLRYEEKEEWNCDVDWLSQRCIISRVMSTYNPKPQSCTGSWPGLRSNWAYHTSHLSGLVCSALLVVAACSCCGWFAMENISQPPSSDRAYYSHYRLTMARSRGLHLRDPALPVIWAQRSLGQNTHRQSAARIATRNVFLPYFCWRVWAVRGKHLSLFSLKTQATQP